MRADTDHAFLIHTLINNLVSNNIMLTYPCVLKTYETKIEVIKNISAAMVFNSLFCPIHRFHSFVVSENTLGNAFMSYNTK